MTAAAAGAWVSRLWLPIVFAVADGYRVAVFAVRPASLGFDARLYAKAADAWLSGGDPWAVSDRFWHFAAPPPTLLLFAPFARLPEELTAAIWMIGSIVLAAAAVRRLGLPGWWVLFPGIVDSVLVANPNAVVLALLVLAGGRLAPLAVTLKVYAVVPLVAERRWKPLAAAGGLLAATVPLLPWGLWWAQLPRITSTLATQAETTSVFGSPVLMALGVVALLSLGLRQAGWLAVPLLWPSTQPHYTAISVPGLTPFLAAAWCLPSPPIMLGSVVLLALWRLAVRFRSFTVRFGTPSRPRAH